jgi:hypothetical protein
MHEVGGGYSHLEVYKGSVTHLERTTWIIKPRVRGCHLAIMSTNYIETRNFINGEVNINASEVGWSN